MDEVDKAFQMVQRADFLPAAVRLYADEDRPLQIGYGQTNSQPSTVRQMLTWLDVQSGHKVLDVGSGSGWTTALLANIVGDNGKVFAVERIPQLLKMGADNCSRLGIKNVQFVQAGQHCGLPQYAPFDRILVSASARKLPDELINQLKISGKIVIPVLDEILEITKTSKTKFQTIIHPGFIFVPLKKLG